MHQSECTYWRHNLLEFLLKGATSPPSTRCECDRGANETDPGTRAIQEHSREKYKFALFLMMVHQLSLNICSLMLSFICYVILIVHVVAR